MPEAKYETVKMIMEDRDRLRARAAELEKALGIILEDQLKRRICPGCGAENPKSRHREWFSCQECEWEWDGKRLPTLGQLMKIKGSLADLHVGKFLTTIFNPRKP